MPLKVHTCDRIGKLLAGSIALSDFCNALIFDITFSLCRYKLGVICYLLKYNSSYFIIVHLFVFLCFTAVCAKQQLRKWVQKLESMGKLMYCSRTVLN